MKGRRCSLNERKKQKIRPVSRSISTESDNSTGSFLVTSTSAAVEYKSEPETLKAEIFIETISSRQPNEGFDIANKTEKGRRRKPSLPLRFSTSLSQTETSKEPSLCKEFAKKTNGGPSRYRRCRLCFPSLKPQVSPPMIGILTASSLISFYSWDNNVGHLTCRRDQTAGSYPEDFSKHDLESISYVQILKTQFEDEVCRYFQQLINVVEFYHSRGVYHRDLKPENLLLDAYGNIKVSDFGLSALSQQIRDYLAIESFKFEENHRRKSKLFSTLSIPEAFTIPFAAAETFNEVQDKCLNLQDENAAGAGQLKETDNCISVGVILQPKEVFKESLEGRKVAASNNIKQLYYDMLTNDDDMSVSDLSQVNCERNVKMPLPTEEHISAPEDSLLFSSIADTNNGDSFPVIETLQLENITSCSQTTPLFFLANDGNREATSSSDRFRRFHYPYSQTTPLSSLTNDGN